MSDPVAYSGENQSAGHGGRVLAKHNLWNCGYFYGAGIIADDLYLAPFKTSPAILLGGVWDDSEASPPTNQVYVSIDCDAYSKPHCVVGFNCRRSHNGCFLWVEYIVTIATAGRWHLEGHSGTYAGD